jgi:hypothetical protein
LIAKIIDRYKQDTRAFATATEIGDLTLSYDAITDEWLTAALSNKTADAFQNFLPSKNF